MVHGGDSVHLQLPVFVLFAYLKGRVSRDRERGLPSTRWPGLTRPQPGTKSSLRISHVGTGEQLGREPATT